MEDSRSAEGMSLHNCPRDVSCRKRKAGAWHMARRPELFASAAGCGVPRLQTSAVKNEVLKVYSVGPLTCSGPGAGRCKSPPSTGTEAGPRSSPCRGRHCRPHRPPRTPASCLSLPQAPGRLGLQGLRPGRSLMRKPARMADRQCWSPGWWGAEGARTSPLCNHAPSAVCGTPSWAATPPGGGCTLKPSSNAARPSSQTRRICRLKATGWRWWAADAGGGGPPAAPTTLHRWLTCNELRALQGAQSSGGGHYAKPADRGEPSASPVPFMTPRPADGICTTILRAEDACGEPRQVRSMTRTAAGSSGQVVFFLANNSAGKREF